MSRSNNARRVRTTDVDRPGSVVPGPVPPRLQARLRTLNQDWIEAPRPDREPAPSRRRWIALWPLVPLLATAGIGLAARQARPWIDREDARLGAAMARALHIDCLGAGRAEPMDSGPACR